jgi:hypothetical protein
MAAAPPAPAMEAPDRSDADLYDAYQPGVEGDVEFYVAHAAGARARVAALAPEVRARIELVEADMRDFSLDRRFALVLIPYRAFLHLLTVEAQRACLRRVRAHLTPGGRLVLNVFDPNPTLIASRLGVAAGALRYSRAFRHPETGRRVLGWEAFRYDPTRQVVDGRFVFEALDARGR